jgi:AcrR family transcriptional regulator
LFRERGYEGATMRAIADAAGVSVGNAYYHFKSKDHLIQAYYVRTHEELAADAGANVLDAERTFRKRLLGVLMAELDLIAPYHEFAGALFRTAADPASPLSPFSEQSRPTRQAATDLFAAIVDGSTAKVDPKLRAELPHLLWLYHMGVLMFWVHDRSPEAQRTRELVERTVPVIDRLIKLARVPGLGPVAHQLVAIARDLRQFAVRDLPATDMKD